ncbi:GTP-binding protein [Brunnivagina elsteri]|uniref:GTPase, G3E family protein n=1 Tax=Brunnivagina elsteri CCALA 953 TaxID=987040 RepID=A0A2A2TAQ9_9CYAN|nr:GTP-binding protein [Calothrix elsteri]PAX49103.1 GTPase, G3E family protein [Calothrix elsteri CCALA 953]
MDIPIITVVAGLAGCGKTTWISQQISQINAGNILYFSPGTGNLPLDQTRLAADFPHIQVFRDGQEIEFIQQIISATAVFIELGAYLELDAVEQILDDLPYRKIAVISPQEKDSEYRNWAQQIIRGAVVKNSIIPTKLWRVPTEGQVVDEESLGEFWYEVTQGAYGQVIRAKGIFDVADGRQIYGDFVAGIPSANFLELDVPRHLEGRPQRFSGIEVLGEDLDEIIMRKTLVDCCLLDATITQYQQQVKQILLEGSVE